AADFVNDCTVRWSLYVSDADGGNTVTFDAGPSIFAELYVLRAKPPTGIKLYHTLVDVSTRGADGQTTGSVAADLAVVKGIAPQFARLFRGQFASGDDNPATGTWSNERCDRAHPLPALPQPHRGREAHAPRGDRLPGVRLHLPPGNRLHHQRPAA